MRKILMAAVAASSLAAAVPAFAQYGYGYNYSSTYSDRAQRLEARIERGQQDGSLTWREARDLRNQLNSVERLEARYAYNGMSAWEARDLERRYDAIAAELRYQRNDNQYRYERSNPLRDLFGY